jgi:hypothetical protein
MLTLMLTHSDDYSLDGSTHPVLFCLWSLQKEFAGIRRVVAHRLVARKLHVHLRRLRDDPPAHWRIADAKRVAWPRHSGRVHRHVTLVPSKAKVLLLTESYVARKFVHEHVGKGAPTAAG